MKLLTFYSDSHKEVYEDFFLKSYNKHLKKSFTLKPRYIEQICKAGSYGSEGWEETMVKKFEHIIDNIDINDKELLVFADCDIQFFKDFSNDITEELGDKDIKFQDDVIAVCAGFFVCKQTKEVLDFFKMVKMYILKYIKPGICDQVVLNRIFEKRVPLKVKWGLLPRTKYFTVASSTCGPVRWTGEDFEPPSDILVHHGNWTVGLDNKLKLMNLVKNKVENAN